MRRVYGEQLATINTQFQITFNVTVLMILQEVTNYFSGVSTEAIDASSV